MTTQISELRKVIKYAPVQNLEGQSYYALSPKTFKRLKKSSQESESLKQVVSTSFMLGKNDRCWYLVSVKWIKQILQE